MRAQIRTINLEFWFLSTFQFSEPFLLRHLAVKSEAVSQTVLLFYSLFTDRKTLLKRLYYWSWRKRTQQLGGPVTFAEDLGSVSNTHLIAHNHP